MWGPIFKQNQNYVVESLDTYIKFLEEFKQSMLDPDETNLYDQMRNANKIRDILNGDSQDMIRKQSTTTKLYTK